MEDSLEKMSDEELKRRYIGLWESVNVFECFSSKDLIELEVIAQELEKRGYEVTETRKPRIRRIK